MHHNSRPFVLYAFSTSKSTAALVLCAFSRSKSKVVPLGMAHRMPLYLGSTIAFSWTMYWQGGARTVKPIPVIPPSRLPFRYLHCRRRRSRPRNSGKTTYYHFNERNEVATSRTSRSALVGNLAPIPQNIYTRFIFRWAASNPRIVDATQPSELACIL
jgi:hypothetical protein